MDRLIKAFRCFAAIIDTGSFTRAAERMHMTQPSLSQQIRELEKHLGFSLVTRSTRSISLTPQGERLLPAVRQMLKESDALLADIQKVQYGLKHELRLGAALYTLDIPERIQLLEGFIAHYPDIPLAIDNSLQSALLRNLWQGKLDLAMIIGMPVPETDFEQRLSLRQDVELLFPDHLPRLTLRREPVRLLVPIESPLAALEQVPARAMHGQRIATLAPGHGDLLVNAIERTLRDAGAEPVYPPESNAIAVERFGRQFRIPAVSLGWFTSGKSNRDNVVERPIEGLSLHTELVLLGNSQQLSHSAARFWSFANGVLPKTI